MIEGPALVVIHQMLHHLGEKGELVLDVMRENTREVK